MSAYFRRSLVSLGFSIFLVNASIALEPTSKASFTHLSPKESLQRLLDGNQRFMQDMSLGKGRDQSRRTKTAEQQLPFAIILGCSDSRVPPELAFDQGIGDIFVVRIAGNIVGAIELDSIEYSALHNHSSIVMVLGHQNCGAVKAVLDKNTQDIESIANFIKPAVESAHDDLTLAIKANIQHSVEEIKKSQPISKLISAGKIDVVGAYYDLETGKVTLLPSK